MSRKAVDHRLLSTTSFYDSQSGKVVELSNVVRLWNLQSFESRTKVFASQDVNNRPVIPHANPDNATIALVRDAFSSQSNALGIQLLSGILGDNGYTRIILATSLEEDADFYENQMDKDLVQEYIEECLWNDIDAPPMGERLTLRAVPSEVNEEAAVASVEYALDANLKNFCVCSEGGSKSISVDLCRNLLIARNIPFEYIDK